MGRATRVLTPPEGSDVHPRIGRPAVRLLRIDIREVGWPQTGQIDITEFVGRFRMSEGR